MTPIAKLAKDSLLENNGIIIFSPKRHLHREAHGYQPAYFPQRKLIGDGASILGKVFWKMLYATREFK